MSSTKSTRRRLLARIFETPSRLIVVASAILGTLIAGQFAYQIYEGRGRALQRAERVTQSARDVLVEHTARTFETVDRALLASIEVRADVVHGTLSNPDAIHDLLKAIHGSSPVLFALGWFDDKGNLLYSSGQRRAPSINIADLEQFRVHAERPDMGLFVSAPARSRVDGNWIITVSRRVNDADGRFAGIINGVLRLEHFNRFYATLDLGRDRSVAVLRRDGVLLIREPFAETMAGRSLAHLPEFKASVGRPLGTIHMRRPIDATPHILSYGLIPGLPLAVTASMSRADALADHHRELEEQAPRVALMLLGLLFGAWLLQRQFQRREAAEHEQALAAAVVQSSGDAIFYRDLGGAIRSWNEGAARLFGYTESEMVGQSYMRLIPPDLEVEGRQFQAALERGERVIGLETMRRRKDGSRVEVSLTLSPVLDRSGAMVGVSTIARDLSERKRTETELGAARQALHAIAANIPGAVYRRVLRPDGNIDIPYISEGVRDLTGIAPEEAMADPAGLRAAVLHDDLDGLHRSIEDSRARGTPWIHEWRLRHRDGTVRWVRGVSNAPQRMPDGGIVWDAVVMDVTALKRAEDAWRASEAREARAHELLREAIDSLSDGFIVYDADDRVVMINKAAKNVHPKFAEKAVPGAHVTELVGAAFDAGLIGEPGESRDAVIAQRMAFHRRAFGQTFERRTGDRWFQVREHPTRDGGIVVVRTDVTALKRHEEALRQSEERATEATARLKDAIESLSDGFLLWDAEDRLVLFNEAAKRTHSDDGAALVPGVRFEDIMAGRVRAGRIEQAKGREEEYIRERTAKHRSPTGEPFEQKFDDGRWISIREHRTREGGIVSIRTDITELKHHEAELVAARGEAEQARARLLHAIESLEDGFLLWSADDRLLLSNSAVAKTNAASEAVPRIGESYRELLQRRLRAGVIPEAKGREAEYAAEMLARRRNPPAEPFEREYAPGHWVSIKQQRTHDGGLVVIRTDVTERKRREAELMAARAEADRANQAKSEFLSRMSHELRTPLNAIIGFAQMLELDRSRTLTPDQLEFSRFISSGGQHLLGLVNDVLDFARIEAGAVKLSLERVPVAVSLDDIRHTMAPMAEKAGVKLDILFADTIPDVRADELRLRQVLINLVSNAIKYNRPGGSVRLAAAAKGPLIRFEITDTGVGIAMEYQPALFQPFQRLGAEHTHVEGTGIGLAICKRLVEAMRGSIGFMSELGKGSTFWVELPAEMGVAQTPAVAEAALAAAAPRAAAGGYTLLYVEDNPANLRLMEHLMATLPGVAMLSAPTSQLGLDLAAAHRPDVIVLDLNLPAMSGYEMLAKLKGMPEVRGVPIMALTAAALPKDVERGLAAGFFRYLTKPIDVKVFLAAVDEALAQRPEREAAAS